MTNDVQIARARAFYELHRRGDPLVLVNAWDAWSAAVVAGAGLSAVATSSHSVAEAAGYRDGQAIPVDTLMAIVARIAASTMLPVSVDIEAGFGDSVVDVSATVDAVLRAGGVGINIEDGFLGGKRVLVDGDLHAAKIAGARSVADRAGVPLFINARFDGFLLDQRHDAGTVDEALRRAAIYKAAGANGFFVPGLANPEWIARIVEESGLPVNIMLLTGTPQVEELTRLGVARISLGPWPFEFVRKALADAVGDFANTGNIASFVSA
jgi:2-methylisocitrate lyase-like PEP mutase family enzyme